MFVRRSHGFANAAHYHSTTTAFLQSCRRHRNPFPLIPIGASTTTVAPFSSAKHPFPLFFSTAITSSRPSSSFPTATRAAMATKSRLPLLAECPDPVLRLYTATKAEERGNRDRGGDDDRISPSRLRQAISDPYLKLVDMCLDYIADNNDRSKKVVEFAEPELLSEKIDFSLPTEGKGLEAILDDISMTMKYSVRTGHPRFYNQLFAGNDLAGVMGEWVTALLNTTSYTFELGPVTTMIEREITQQLCNMAGFKEGEGVFTPGGSLAILMAMILARNDAQETVNDEGLYRQSKQLVCFTSAQAHYAVRRGAAICGIGRDAVRYIPCDREGRMIPSELEKALQATLAEGHTPMMVNATAGTTVLCAFDPFEDIADLCEKYNVWMHVDGCQGGSLLFSQQHRHLLKGLHRADSMTWNPHKMMGLPLQCSVILTRRRGALLSSNSSCADYLFHQHPLMEYDLGDKTIQCGRKLDHLKLWLSWKAHGSQGFEYRIDKALENSAIFTQMVKERSKRFRMVVDTPICHSVPFWCIPPNAESVPHLSPEWIEAVNEAAHKIRHRMRVRGNMMLNYQPLKDQSYPYFFRLTVHNPTVTHDDLVFVLDEFERIMDEVCV